MSPLASVSVWLSLFIPRDVPGYTKEITTGDNKGKTAVPLPKIARLPFNALKPIGTGYLTDQRTFSDKPTASVRMQSGVAFKLYPPGDIRGWHETSGTTEVNIDSGETQDTDMADMSDCKTSRLYKMPFEFAESIYNDLETGKASLEAPNSYNLFLQGPIRHRAKRWNPADSQDLTKPFGMMVNVSGSASDPLVHMAANIDYDISFAVGVDPSNARVIVACVGFIDSYPAYECYARYADTTQTLFTLPPPKGNTVVDLLGGPTRAVTAATSFEARCRIPNKPPDPAQLQELMNTLLGHGP